VKITGHILVFGRVRGPPIAICNGLPEVFEIRGPPV